jgi:hypothetical protein
MLAIRDAGRERGLARPAGGSRREISGGIAGLRRFSPGNAGSPGAQLLGEGKWHETFGFTPT